MALTQAQRDAKRSTVLVRVEEEIAAIIRLFAANKIPPSTIKNEVDQVLRERFLKEVAYHPLKARRKEHGEEEG